MPAFSPSSKRHGVYWLQQDGAGGGAAEDSWVLHTLQLSRSL